MRFLQTLLLISTYSILVCAQLDVDANNYLPVFSTTDKFFSQSDATVPPADVNYTHNFGLFAQYTWDDVVQSLGPNEKLFFLQRHGEGYHNVAPGNFTHDEWVCYWSLQPGKDGVIWQDAELTPHGIKQIQSISRQINQTVGFPEPQRFYVSPLRRTLQTWLYTWSNLPHLKPVIKELAREVYGIDTESQRHSKSYISENYPYFDFEPGFSEKDVAWEPDTRERTQHVDYRAAKLLTEIFDESNDDEKVISVVLHSGIIYSILNVVGHRYFPMYTGQAIPVIVTKQEKHTTYPLDNAWLDFEDWCPSE
ncbi:Phosphomutase-like protein 3 [Candida viswanathii]|uniref:Phosphomutase-like protein 3 n=1 Tax=Candida viswanathii TaxID=5486 RepID=A0A367XWW3_9ASCO|nr:Phosphomutase-like protein 3 [Candida viswanathii]